MLASATANRREAIRILSSPKWLAEVWPLSRYSGVSMDQYENANNMVLPAICGALGLNVPFRK